MVQGRLANANAMRTIGAGAAPARGLPQMCALSPTSESNAREALLPEAGTRRLSVPHAVAVPRSERFLSRRPSQVSSIPKTTA